MIIDGKDVFADEKFEDRSPINTDWMLAVMQKGNEKHAQLALGRRPQSLPRLEPHSLAGARRACCAKPPT